MVEITLSADLHFGIFQSLQFSTVRKEKKITSLYFLKLTFQFFIKKKVVTFSHGFLHLVME